MTGASIAGRWGRRRALARAAPSSAIPRHASLYTPQMSKTNASRRQPPPLPPPPPPLDYRVLGLKRGRCKRIRYEWGVRGVEWGNGGQSQGWACLSASCPVPCRCDVALNALC